MPLPVAIALPVLFPEHFVADGARGDWIEQFGFIRSDGGGEPTTGLEAKRLGLLRLVKFSFLFNPLHPFHTSPLYRRSGPYSNCSITFPFSSTITRITRKRSELRSGVRCSKFKPARKFPVHFATIDRGPLDFSSWPVEPSDARNATAPAANGYRLEPRTGIAPWPLD